MERAFGEAADIAENLEAWFSAAARDLPWRDDPSPYRVWISEVMLQQTTVAAVRPFFEAFMRRFPTLQALAEANEEDALAVWSGLGYYSRARNLVRAARILWEDGRALPEDPVQLRALPGIGPYTAGAISAIAFDRPAAMVDANVRRLLGRVLAISDEESGAEELILRLSLAISSAGSPRVVNQAMMEIGALVCVPGPPKCPECPLAAQCRAHQLGRFEWFGSMSRKRPLQAQQEVCMVTRWKGDWLLARPRDGRWPGMWEFPRSEAGLDAKEAGRALLQDEMGAMVDELEHVGALRHTVTHHRITLHVLKCRMLALPSTAVGNWRLATGSELSALPLPTPMRRIAVAHASPSGGLGFE